MRKQRTTEEQSNDKTSKQLVTMGPKESDPLLINQRQSNNLALQSNNKKKCANCRPQTIIAMILVALAAGIFLIPVIQHSISSDVMDESLAEISNDGEYIVHYPRNVTSNTTFGELASTMLPPWYQASLLAVTHDLDADSMDPTSVQKARKVLLTTRDLLDVFSPVYGSAIWKKLRKLYKHGYETVGYYQDLDHAHIAYNKDLWNERRDAILAWKKEFVSYVERPSVRHFVLHGAAGCNNNHKQSHLFWDDELMMKALPCASDLAMASVSSLASIQLSNALDYLETVSHYKTVLEVAQEEDFHNLRKTLRSFEDEYTLFGTIVLPTVSVQYLETLTASRELLGDINDHWTAYNTYVTRHEHAHKAKMLALKIGRAWKEFKAWAITNDLSGAIQGLLDEVQQSK